MQQDQPFNEQESLLIIQQMIHTAKQEQKDDGKGWIIWGWLLFLTSLLTFANVQFRWFSPSFFWNVFGVISILFGLYTGLRYFLFKKTTRVKTYTSDLFEKLNIGFFIFLAFIILAINLGIGPIKGFAFLISLYGFWVLIYGTVLNFRPSIIAAFITWAIGFGALYIHKLVNTAHEQFQWMMLVHALAVLCGYIIPGHMANKEFNKINRKANNQCV
jgi:hypothetical protein